MKRGKVQQEWIKCILLGQEDEGKWSTRYIPSTETSEAERGRLLESFEEASLLGVYEPGDGISGDYYLTKQGHVFAGAEWS